MRISTKDWKNYISKLHRLSDQAANELQAYISKNGFANTNEIIDLAYALISKYGEGSAELACQMYEATAALEGVKILPAEPAPTATYEETAKAINGSLLQSPSGKKLTQVVQRHVKQAAADTTLKNAIRDKAMWAWIPSGDTCAFCLTLSSRGWQKASTATLKGNHAEHIHANCDCNFCVRFGNNLSVEGYDPDALREMYESMEGKRPGDKINAIRRINYQKDKDNINARKRELYKEKNTRSLNVQLPFGENGQKDYIPKGAEIISVKTIAGKGSNTKLRVASKLAEEFGGDPEEWEKRVGKIDSDKYTFDVHWYEKDGIMYKPKIKMWKEKE